MLLVTVTTIKLEKPTEQLLMAVPQVYVTLTSSSLWEGLFLRGLVGLKHFLGTWDHSEYLFSYLNTIGYIEK